MLFVNYTTSSIAAQRYFDSQLNPSDYYAKDAPELSGEWFGLGTELMGLKGNVEREQFFRLCQNLHPVTGEHLTPRTRADRRVLYDFTFDCPKSVSLAFELGGHDQILDAFRDAVKETLGFMERDVMTRVRTNGQDTDRSTANLAAALFVHRTTRPVDGLPDPQLHCHATIFNCTFDTEEDRWKAAQMSTLVRDKGYHQAAFHSRLASQLRDLGYGIERDGNSFRLAGIDREICDTFSRRKAIIEAEAERLGIVDPKAKGELGRQTREAKDTEGVTISELRESWRERVGHDELAKIRSARSCHQTRTLNAFQAMDYAIEHCYERASVVPERELLKHALIESVGRATVQEVQGELLRPNIIRRTIGGQRHVTTKEVHAEELSLAASVRENRGRYRKLGKKDPDLDPTLSDEQRKAALTILNSRDFVVGLRGNAGTGKTRLMRATIDAIEQNSHKVFAFAPSAEASRGVLRDEGFSEADTVERLLTDNELQNKLRGQALWVDEAGLLSVRDMNRLLTVARRNDCRVILGGDSKQHGPVARGHALALLEKDAGMRFANLATVRRQTNEAYREAISAISEGDAPARNGGTRLQEGVALLDRMGAIIETEGDERHRQIAADYVAVTSEFKGNNRKTALVISPTHAEAHRVTACIREELRAAGRLDAAEREVTSLRPTNFTEAQRKIAGNYAAGQVAQFHQNAKGFTRGTRVRVTGIDADAVRVERSNGIAEVLPLKEARNFQVFDVSSISLSPGDKIRITQNGFAREERHGGRKTKPRLNNGSLYEVAGFTSDGDIRLTNKRIIPRDYGNLSHGYVMTSHASQGKGVDVALIAMGLESFGATNREQFYVSVSRGKEAVRLYTDDKAAVLSAAQASAVRMSATELIQSTGPAPKPPSTRMQKLFQMKRLQDIYAAVRQRAATIIRRPTSREEPRLGR